jgi:SnoaL-like protein
MAEKELEKRIAQLEDIEAIRQLKARYCLYVDQRKEDAWVSRAAISSLLVCRFRSRNGFGT